MIIKAEYDWRCSCGARFWGTTTNIEALPKLREIWLATHCGSEHRETLANGAPKLEAKHERPTK
jgi:hypothetical protein